MKRLTESQLRQVIREELVALLNEIEDLEFDVVEAGEIKKKERLLSLTGAQIVNLFPKFNEMIKNKKASLIPLPLRHFQIDYETLVKNTRDEEEVKNKKVIIFYYNPVELSIGGYSIEMFPLSTGPKPKGQQFVTHEAHEMTQVSLRTDRQDFEKYENVLGISIPEPKNLNVRSSPTLRPRLPDARSQDFSAFTAQLDREQEGIKGYGLPKGLRENKKRKR